MIPKKPESLSILSRTGIARLQTTSSFSLSYEAIKESRF
jgi:hypothetical protein